MKAVNLIPSDERRGFGAGASSVGSYILLGVLFVVVVAGAGYALANRTVSDRRHELANVQAQVTATAAEAQALQTYTAFSDLRQKRSETVRSLASSRFDWSHALHEVSRTIPSDAWLTALRATVTPATAVDGGVTDPLRTAVQAPAIEIVGCTTSQDKVASLISSLRRIEDIQRVSLSSTEKLAAGGSGASGGASGSDCRYGNSHYPMFSMTLFFNATSTPSTGQGTTP
jgi:Tfp pilus assembly protein PilN